MEKKVARRTKTAAVAKVTKAIAKARGTDELIAPLTSRSGGNDPIANDIDEVARSGIRLSFLMHDVSRMRRSAYDQHMKPLGVTRAQWWVLAHLSRHDGMMQTQLADVLEVGKASLGDVIESLETGGWVNRHPDPSDRRAKRVYLAKSAQALIQRMTQLEVEFNSRIFSALSLDERTTLFQSLTKVKLAIAALSEESPLASN